MGSIVTMKEEIKSYLSVMRELGYTLSEEEKMVFLVIIVGGNENVRHAYT